MRFWELLELCEDKGLDVDPGESKDALVEVLCRGSLGMIRGIESEVNWEPSEKDLREEALKAAKTKAARRDARTIEIAAAMGFSPGNSDARRLRARMALRAPLLWPSH